jgi:hypothetical protein
MQANIRTSYRTRGHNPSVRGVTLHFANLFLSAFNVPTHIETPIVVSLPARDTKTVCAFTL